MAETRPWRFAVSTNSLPNRTPAQTASLVRAAGYDGILLEVRAAHDREIEPSVTGLADICSSNGLCITGLACEPDPQAPADIAGAVELAIAAGASQLRLRPASLRSQAYRTAYDATLRLCESYVAAASDTGVRVVLQQCWGTIAPSATQLFDILSHFDARDIGCIYDAGSMTVEGYESYRIGLEVLGDYVTDVHVKNARFFPALGGVWEWEWSGLADGLIDLRALFRALRGVDYKGWITLADESGSPDEAAMLNTSAAMLRQAVAES